MTAEVRVTDPVTGGQKGSKPERFDLLPWGALEEVARVYDFGARKYEPNNWLRGYAWSLSIAALFRHVVKFSLGEDRDAESGLHHLAHAVFHAFALITFGTRKLGTDDRTKANPDPEAHLYYEVGSDEEPVELVPADFTRFADEELDEIDFDYPNSGAV